MRIPWYITWPLALAVFFTVLWQGARQHDFTREPSESELALALAKWQQRYPPLALREQPVAPQVNAEEPTNEEVSAPSPLDFGDLNLAPALDHYLSYAPQGASQMIDLAERLEQAGHTHHAQLAWERVLDACEPTEAERATACAALLRLGESAPLWNVDSTSNLPVVLHVNVPEIWKSPSSAALSQLAPIIQQASGGQVQLQLLLKSAPQRPGFPPPPINLWLSATGDSPKSTPQLTFHLKLKAQPVEPDPDATAEMQASIREQLYAAVYRAITSQLERQALLTPPAELNETMPAEQAMRCQLTRLHWYKFASTLDIQETQPSESTEPAVEESDHEVDS